MKQWPKDFYCSERTLDIKLPSGVTARVWFDGNSPDWDQVRLVDFGRRIKQEVFERSPRESLCEILNWIATFPGVNAVQVHQELSPGITVGVMAYTVPFENAEPLGAQPPAPATT